MKTQDIFSFRTKHIQSFPLDFDKSEGILILKDDFKITFNFVDFFNVFIHASKKIKIISKNIEKGGVYSFTPDDIFFIHFNLKFKSACIKITDCGYILQYSFGFSNVSHSAPTNENFQLVADSFAFYGC